MSREIILAEIIRNQPDHMPLPDMQAFDKLDADGSLQKFTEVLSAIGGRAIQVKNYTEIEQIISAQYGETTRIITPVTELTEFYAPEKLDVLSIHDYQDVALTVVNGHFAVAENGGIWLTEDLVGHRVLPFISEHVAIIIKARDIVPTMHKAYEIIADSDYGFGVFIAGPSKTADIEQSLVIGAHGPKSMTAFVLGID